MLRLLCGFWWVFCIGGALAQDLQPRRWSHLPLDTNFSGLGYAFTSAEIFLDPSLRVEDAELDLHSGVFSYIRSFEFFGRTARFDLVQAYQDARWQGLLNGRQASTSRTGFDDLKVRFAMNLIGAPPLKGQEFVDYRKSVRDGETSVGAGVVVSLPTGHYEKDKRLNLGANRFTIRPQLGIVHQRGPWSFECTGSVWLFTANDSFFNGKKLEQDPLFSLQGHVVYTFRPGFWVGTGASFGMGGRTAVDGREANDYRNNLLWGASAGFSVSRELGFRVSYIRTRTLERTGFDADTVIVGASLIW